MGPNDESKHVFLNTDLTEEPDIGEYSHVEGKIQTDNPFKKSTTQLKMQFLREKYPKATRRELRRRMKDLKIKRTQTAAIAPSGSSHEE